jgi:hypothetical protein
VAFEFTECGVLILMLISALSYLLPNTTVTTGIWMSVMVSSIPLRSHLSAETAN